MLFATSWKSFDIEVDGPNWYGWIESRRGFMTSIHISHNILLWIGHIMYLASEGIGEINDKWVKQQWSYEYSIYENSQGRYIRIVTVQGRRKRQAIVPEFKENKGWANIAG